MHIVDRVNLALDTLKKIEATVQRDLGGPQIHLTDVFLQQRVSHCVAIYCAELASEDAEGISDQIRNVGGQS